jgi:rhodanese-related sulfurtransferase
MKTRIFRASSLALLVLLAATGTAIAQETETLGSTTIGADELMSRIEAETAPTILDVRTPEEFSAGHVPGAINIPYTELEERYSELELEGSDELVVYCQSGRRAAIVEAALGNLGFTNVRDLEGHIEAWKEAERPLE